MSARVRFNGTTVDAPDALALASFYAEVTGGTAHGDAHWAAVTGLEAFLAFEQVPDFRRPEWPGSVVPKQMHLDFLVDDLDETGARVLAAGATKFDVQPNADHCFVYADPAGHPFCLTTWDGPSLVSS